MVRQKLILSAETNKSKSHLNASLFLQNFVTMDNEMLN